MIAGVLAAAVLVGLLLGADAGASSSVVCNTCHEMQPWVATWSTSSHANVACSACHGTARPWYGQPLSMMERGAKLGRDVSAHWSGSTSQVATSVPALGVTGNVQDSACLQCHDLSRKVTPQFGVQIDHQAHAKRNGRCASCHRWTAHARTEAADRGSAMMLACFDCHGLSKTAKAPGRCDFCHAKGTDLRPPSHRTGTWLDTHGPIALKDRKTCLMCHQASFCSDCHVLDMPHPAGWAGKGTPLHAAVAKQEPQVCTRCHKGATNLCNMCHHPAFDANKGPWVQQHPAMVAATGVAFCFKCHTALFCSDCHAKRPSE